ncbi:MAG: DUF928 domain-containing protein [Limnoraphis sp. WC205]|nr:DUF928 domain-containing protein [Limnoraphis sp. WC205]
MLWKNRFSQSIQLAVTLILVGIELASPPLVMSNSSEESDRQNNSPSDQTTLNFQPPNRGAPGTRADAGSRGGSGQCSKLEKPITALIPTTNWGETIAAHPTFWLYIPTSSAATVELVLKPEGSDDVLYEVKFPVTQGPGIVSFRPPETAPPLEEGKAYRWMFNFYCSSEVLNASTRSNIQSNFTVSGIVARVAPSRALKQQLEKAGLTEKLNLYAENGLWYETLTQLAERRRTDPQNSEVADQWMDLLQHKAVLLNNIAQEPILACCQLEPKNTLSLPFKPK